MLATPYSNVTLANAVQSENAKEPIAPTAPGIVRSVSEEHPWNAYEPISFTPAGIVRSASEEHALKV